MRDLVARLSRLPPKKWWFHEKVVCRELGFTRREGTPVRKQLTELLLAIKKGYFGNKNEPKITGFEKTDLANTSIQNQLNIHCVKHGYKEDFAADSLSDSTTVFASPRYFRFGTLNAGPTVKTQCSIMRCRSTVILG
jgi:hypothetical protein